MKIEQGINDAKEALKGSDASRIKKAKDDLIAASHKLAEQVYKEASAKAQAGEKASDASAGGSDEKSSKKEEAVEAEVVDEGKEK
jgi:molecular chaperone DnaK